jgi:hypothetical protein
MHNCDNGWQPNGRMLGLDEVQREEFMSEHKLLFSLVVLASFVSLGWILVIYVLSFHAARWLVDMNDVGYVPHRHELRLGRPALRYPH